MGPDYRTATEYFRDKAHAEKFARLHGDTMTTHLLDDGEPKRGVTYRAPSGRLCKYSKPGPSGSIFFSYIDSKEDGFLASLEFFARWIKRAPTAVQVPK